MMMCEVNPSEPICTIGCVTVVVFSGSFEERTSLDDTSPGQIYQTQLEGCFSSFGASTSWNNHSYQWVLEKNRYASWQENRLKGKLLRLR